MKGGDVLDAAIRVNLIMMVPVLLFDSGGAALSGRDCLANDLMLRYELCMGRAQLVEVGQNTSIAITWNPHDQNLTDEIILDTQVKHNYIAEAPPEVSVRSGTTGRLLLTGVRAGKTVVSFHCEVNVTDNLCPFSKEVLYPLKREVSFVNLLPLDVVALVVGWIYTIFWIVSYYPQKYYSCKRGSVAGLNFNFVGMCFTSSIAYLTFNVSLFLIPQVQEEYFRRHPAGVNPVHLNDVAFSMSSFISLCVWIIQCGILKREGQRLSCAGGLFICSLWLLMLTCVVLGAAGVMEWLDTLYIISYVTLITTPVKYIPLIWTNFRRKSTEGFSPYTTMLNLLGGILSVLQMLLLAYNYDDWKSILGDPTKFALGVITIGFETVHFSQHYVLYRGAWMRSYKLAMDCTCTEAGCKHERKTKIIRSAIALPENKIMLKRVQYYDIV